MHKRDLLETPSVTAGRRRWGRHLLLTCLFGLALALVCPYLFVAYRSSTELQEALDEADRTDPGWRLQDLEANRLALPDEQNSALPLIAAKQLMPPQWPTIRETLRADKQDLPDEELHDLEDSLWNPEPPVQLDARQIKLIGVELKRAAAALTQARKVADLPHGRYPIVYAPDFISTQLGHTQDARSMANLLSFDVLLRAQEQDLEGAMTSCRALVNTGRSIGDEPTLISTLVRIALRAVVLKKVERVLAQGQPSEASLAALQRLLEEEASESLLLIGVRGDRALTDGMMEAFEKGDLKLAQFRSVMGGGGGGGLSGDLEDLQFRFLPGSLRRNRAALLRYHNRAVEIARQPVEERRGLMEQLDAEARELPRLARLLAPAITKVAEADRRTQADLRGAIVLVAAERYRRAKGRWPTALTDLVPAYLAKVPIDPYDAQPLRYRRLKDGVVIYSVGLDEVDNGGNLSDKPLQAGTDRGFRLWDVDQRRQPPRPRDKSKDN